MEEAPENGKESSHSAHGNGMNEYFGITTDVRTKKHTLFHSGTVKTCVVGYTDLKCTLLSRSKCTFLVHLLEYS
jgi:hypothetical protein